MYPQPISWKSLLQRVRLVNLVPAITIVHEHPLLIVSGFVRDRRTGEPTFVRARYQAFPFLYEPQAAHYLRQCLHHYVGHEVDEAFHLDGRRIFDPHPFG